VEWEWNCRCATAEARARELYREAWLGRDGCHDLPGRAASLRRLQFDRAGARALGWLGRGFVRRAGEGTWGTTGRAGEVGGAAAVSSARRVPRHVIPVAGLPR
jgi:hypothetical protein